MATKKKTAVKNANLVNHVILVVDRSGSMQNVKSPTERAIRSNIDTLQAKARETGQVTTLTYIKFDTHVDIDFVRRNVLEAPKSIEIDPRGGTSLIDATITAINEGLKFDDAKKKTTSFLLMVLTDGEENSSSAQPTDLEKKLAQVNKTDRWTTAFMVPNQYGKNMLQRMGVPEDNIKTWTQTAQGAKEIGDEVNTGISAYYALRSVGKTSTKGFFQPDMSKVKAKDLKKLDDVRHKAKIWTVGAEMPIQQFVENKNVFYKPGNGFYQLMKREEVQYHKAIAIVDKATGAVYTGPQARNVLGLPNLDVKIAPGNHGNFDIFIQSTSNNRKLPRGTKLLYIA